VVDLLPFRVNVIARTVGVQHTIAALECLRGCVAISLAGIRSVQDEFCALERQLHASNSARAGRSAGRAGYVGYAWRDDYISTWWNRVLLSSSCGGRRVFEGPAVGRCAHRFHLCRAQDAVWKRLQCRGFEAGDGTDAAQVVERDWQRGRPEAQACAGARVALSWTPSDRLHVCIFWRVLREGRDGHGLERSANRMEVHRSKVSDVPQQWIGFSTVARRRRWVYVERDHVAVMEQRLKKCSALSELAGSVSSEYNGRTMQ
jgi:hypothetical protein